MQNSQADSPEQVKYRKDYQVSNFLIEKVELDFELHEEFTLVTSNLSIKHNPLSKDDSKLLKLNGEQLELLSLKLNGELLSEKDYQVSAEHLSLKVELAEFELTSVVKIYPDKNTSLEGLYRSSGKYCTQCEAEGFRKITYFLDRPDVMATFWVTLSADKKLYPHLLSNGNKLEQGDLDDGRHYAKWHDPFKKPSYLFALCAGDYDLLEDSFVTQSGRKVALEIYVDKGKLDQCDHAMASLKKSMTWDEDTFGLEYDLDIYMIVAVGDFNMGAMENKGLNVFNTKYVLARTDTATDQDFEGVEAVIGHEYFHNWTGNRVTCQDWFQLSLKEGLTVFRDQQFTADQTDHAVKRIEDVKVIRAHQFAEDGGPMAHPIRPDSYIEMNNFYTVTVYNKGAEIIRMYHTLLGKDGFRRGMDLYFKRHDGQAVTCEDFICAMEEANDYPLKQFRRWYSQAGTPEVFVESNYDSSKQQLKLSIKQSCPATPGQEDKQAFHIPLRVAFFNQNSQKMALNLDGAQAEQLQGDILHITQVQQEFVFDGVSEQPILSLLRNFSAPVKLHYDYSDKELAFLFAQDDDQFNRWDAGQRLFTKVIWDLCNQLESNQPMTLPEHLVDAVKSILDAGGITGQFKSLALTLPDVKALIEEVERVNIDHLLEAHKFVKEQLAQRLEMDWLLHYQANHHLGEYQQDKVSIGKRAYSATCLQYLMQLNKAEVYELAVNQLENANNMTDAALAFQAVLHSDYEGKDAVSEAFYQQWKDEELVVNKWLSVLASAPQDSTMQLVTELLQHPAFEMSNPNSVRSLIGVFAGANIAQFHRADGAGYQYLADQIQALYAVNPQTAARLTGAFNRWKKFDDGRQKQMKEQLERILSMPDLARDVYEIASKALV